MIVMTHVIIGAGERFFLAAIATVLPELVTDILGDELHDNMA
jgi:hypothetical protein